LLIQDKDLKNVEKNELKFFNKKPNKNLIDDMLFAFTVSKFINSNAIVISKGLATVGIGIGQTNRIDSAKQAIKRKKTNFGNVEAVLASDGFFPFPDIVKICSKNKIKAIIQPGGSLNDNSVIKEAKKQNINLVFTGIRHFKH
jgi:phosphoribosylaminoimidazolecarboxamide formyltransferase/IMP cyclohydrolase